MLLCLSLSRQREGRGTGAWLEIVWKNLLKMSISLNFAFTFYALDDEKSFRCIENEVFVPLKVG